MTLSSRTSSQAELLAAIANAYGAMPVASAKTSGIAKLYGAWYAAVVGGGNPWLRLSIPQMLAAIRNQIVGGPPKSYLTTTVEQLLADIASNVAGSPISQLTTSVGDMLAVITGGNDPIRAKAQALLVARAAAVPIVDALGNDVPVISQSSSFGNSALTGAAFGSTNYSMSMLDPTLTTLGNPLVVNGSLPFCTTEEGINTDGLKGGGAGAGKRFKLHGATAFDVGVYGNNNSIRVKVNGAWTEPQTMANAAWLQYTFPTTSDRVIEFYWTEGTVLAGLNVSSGGAIQAAPITSPQVAVFGDSYTMASYAAALASPDRPVSAFPAKLREDLGILNMICLGFNGQGTVFTDPTYSTTFLDRANAGDFSRFPDIDLLIIYNSVNDFQQTAATVQSRWQTIIQEAMAAQPNALIFGFTGFKTSQNPVDSTHNAAFVNAFNAVKDARRMAVWDGNDQIVTVGGNDSVWVSGDHLHLSDAGSIGAAGIVGAQIENWLLTLGGLSTPAWVPTGSLAYYDFENDRSYSAGAVRAAMADFATVRSSSGLDLSATTSFAANQPRRTPAGLLVEAAATNFQIRSQDFSSGQSEWVRDNLAVALVAGAPDGTSTVNRLTMNSGSGNGVRIRANFYGNGNDRTASIIYRSGGPIQFIHFRDSSTATVGLFDTVNNQYLGHGYYDGTTLGGAPVAGGVVPLGNGWYRAWMQVHSASSSSFNPLIYFSKSATTTQTTWSGTESIDLWGVQIETGTQMTSYIPTTTAGVQKTADAISLTLPAGTGHVLLTYRDIVTGTVSTTTVTQGSGSYTLPANPANANLINMKVVA